MSSKASDEELRGVGSRGQRPEETTAEGLGGAGVAEFDNPRTRTGLTDVYKPKDTDPEWVRRRDPASLPKHAGGSPAGEPNRPFNAFEPKIDD